MALFKAVSPSESCVVQSTNFTFTSMIYHVQDELGLIEIQIFKCALVDLLAECNLCGGSDEILRPRRQKKRQIKKKIYIYRQKSYGTDLRPDWLANPRKRGHSTHQNPMENPFFLLFLTRELMAEISRAIIQFVGFGSTKKFTIILTRCLLFPLRKIT